MKPFYIITRTALYDDHRFCLEEIFLDIDKKGWSRKDARSSPVISLLLQATILHSTTTQPCDLLHQCPNFLIVLNCY